MNEPIISEILQDMLPVLDNSQLAKLKLAIYKIKKNVLGRRLAT